MSAECEMEQNAVLEKKENASTGWLQALESIVTFRTTLNVRLMLLTATFAELRLCGTMHITIRQLRIRGWKKFYPPQGIKMGPSQVTDGRRV